MGRVVRVRGDQMARHERDLKDMTDARRQIQALLRENRELRRRLEELER